MKKNKKMRNKERTLKKNCIKSYVPREPRRNLSNRTVVSMYTEYL